MPTTRRPGTALRTPRALPWLLGTGLLLTYAGTVAGDAVANDVSSASLAAWRIATTGSPWFDAFQFTHLEIRHELLWTGVATNGHVAVFRSPGAIAAGVPAYLVGHRGSAPEEFSLLPGSLFAALLTAIAMVLFFQAIRARMGDGPALAAVGALGLATPVWSVSANSLWPHTLTGLGIAGIAWAASRERWWLVGVFGGLALWGRLHAALVVAAVGLLIGLWRRRPSITARAAVPSLALLGLAACWSRWMYGEWDPAGGYPTVDRYAARAVNGDRLDQLVNYLGLVFSPDRGIALWTPVLLVLLPALVRGWRTLPHWVRALAWGGVSYTFAQGLMNHFAGGSGFFGYRLTLELLLCLFPAYALSAHRMGRIAKPVLGPLLGLQFAAIAIGATSNGFLLPVEEAWRDSSIALVLRTYPALWLWLALMLLVGHLAGRVWRDRELGGPVALGSVSVRPADAAHSRGD